MSSSLNRRQFFVAGGGALTLAFTVSGRQPRLAAAFQDATPENRGDLSFSPNVWLTVEASGDIVIALHKTEMGQGVMTALPMVVAEELDADWGRVRVEPAYGDPAFGSFGGTQFTFGSTSVAMSWDALRLAGATARAMLIEAAAGVWDVPAGECRAERGEVIHEANGKRLRYGELAGIAAALPIPEDVVLKSSDRFTLVGQSLPRLDLPGKSDGSARFAADVAVPGMLTAVMLRPPVYGAEIASYDASMAMMIPGVRAVVEIAPFLPGVDVALAVVADGFWPASRGRDALRVDWRAGAAARLDSAVIRERMREMLSTSAPLAYAEGDTAAAFVTAQTVIEAEYDAPYLAHASMEPMSCAAHVQADGVDVWVGTQSQTAAVQIAAAIAGVDPGQVRLHQQFPGGGFGRRAESDFVADAVSVSKAVGAPVKVVWPREEDFRHDFFRPASIHRVRLALDDANRPVAWDHRVAGDWIAGERFPMFFATGPDGASYDPNSVAALTEDFVYLVPNRRIETANVASGIPIGFWRGVGHSTNVWVIESTIDEAAAAVAQDPLRFRRALLTANPRAIAVLDRVAAASDWDRPLGANRGRGVALVAYPQTIVAAVVEVTAVGDGDFTIDRVVIAADCGIVVNPGILAQQLEGGALQGISAALSEEMTFADGAAVQTSFETYPVLRFPAAPPVEVVIVASEAPPGGIGEPPTVVVVPALSNAVAAATGVRPRRLPLRPAERDVPPAAFGDADNLTSPAQMSARPGAANPKSSAITRAAL